MRINSFSRLSGFDSIYAQAYLKELIAQVEADANLTLHLGTTVQQVNGYIGNFTTLLADGTEIAHGAAVIATGAGELEPLSISMARTHGF